MSTFEAAITALSNLVSIGSPTVAAKEPIALSLPEPIAM